jgi:hypothetical protein
VKQRILTKEEFIYCIVKVLKSVQLLWVGYVGSKGERRNTYKILGDK